MPNVIIQFSLTKEGMQRGYYWIGGRLHGHLTIKAQAELSVDLNASGSIPRSKKSKPKTKKGGKTWT